MRKNVPLQRDAENDQEFKPFRGVNRRKRDRVAVVLLVIGPVILLEQREALKVIFQRRRFRLPLLELGDRVDELIDVSRRFIASFRSL